MNEREQKTIPHLGTSFAPREPPSASSIKSTPAQHFTTYQSKYAKPYVPYNYMPTASLPKYPGMSAGKSLVENTPEPVGTQIFQKNLSATSISSNPYLSSRLAGLKTYTVADINSGTQELNKMHEKINTEEKNDASEATFEPKSMNSILPIKYTQPQ